MDEITINNICNGNHLDTTIHANISFMFIVLLEIKDQMRMF